MDDAVKIIHRALDLGVNFFDSAHHYNKGLSDEAYGKALSGGLRKKALLMSKASSARAMRPCARSKRRSSA